MSLTASDLLTTLAKASKETLHARLRLQLETGGDPVPLRENYLEQIFRFCHGEYALVDLDWLRVPPEEAVHFVTQAGTQLPVLLLSEEKEATGEDTAPAAREERMHVMVDQSGSMAGMNAAAYEGARELVQGLPETARVTFSTFADNVCMGQCHPPATVLQELRAPRVARGGTALRDAIVDAVVREEGANADAMVTIVILTDGQDTASRRATDADVRAVIARAQARPKWRVLFLGTNQDAVLSAQRFGIAPDRALTFNSSQVTTAFRAASDLTTSSRSGGTGSFTPVQRAAAVSSR